MIIIVCSTCGKPFDSDRKLRKYCSLKCAAITNNKKFPKREYTHFCQCGQRMSIYAKRCQKCTYLIPFNAFMEKTLAEIRNKKWGTANQWNDLRTHAKRAMVIWEIEKRCSKCNWDFHVEVSHKKAISSFPLDTKVKEVNSKTNLEYHCPNDHWLYENGIIAQPGQSNTLSR